MLASYKLDVASTHRGAWLEIDLEALRGNVGVIRSWLTSNDKSTLSELHEDGRETDIPQLMTVIKSDGYGHGALEIAPTLLEAGAKWFAVAEVTEACKLRTVFNAIPILTLGPAPPTAYDAAIENSLDLTISSSFQLDELAAAAKRHHRKARLHIKVDTGMHRIGVSPAHFLNLLESVVASPHLELAGICSHLAKADDIDFTNKQKVIFQNCLKKTKDRYPHILKSCGGTVLAHLASSDAARRFPDTHFDMVRAGLMLYGLESRAISNVVQPVMSVRARISQVNDVDEGEGVGYNLTWTAARPSRLASIPVGYADGVNRKLSNKMYGILRGKLVNQVGTISMDQMLFDVTDIRDASEGEIITLIGSDGSETIFLADWAEKLETITYEVACAMRMRLPRIYVGATAP